MFTASEDGTISMWKTRSWEMLRSLKGHKAHVTAVAVHPSGKLGLSVGSDRSLLTWDFVTGKLAFRRKIKEAASNILFTFTGNHYITVFQKRIEVHSLDGTHLVQEIATSWRINEVCLVQDSILAVAGDDRHILLVNALTGKQILTLDMAKPGEDTFNTRVRCVRAVAFEGQTLVVAATANGNIKIFKVNVSENLADLVLFYEAKVRVTCLAAYNFAAGPNIEEGASEDKASKQGKAKIRKEKTVTESDKLSAEAEPDDDEEEEVEENEDSDTNIRATARKRKRQQRPQPRNKKRKLNETEADQTGNGNSTEKASAPSRTPQRPARQLKKKKKKIHAE